MRAGVALSRGVKLTRDKDCERLKLHFHPQGGVFFFRNLRGTEQTLTFRKVLWFTL